MPRTVGAGMRGSVRHRSLPLRRRRRGDPPDLAAFVVATGLLAGGRVRLSRGRPLGVVVVLWVDGYTMCVNDPSAGSPTER